MQTTVTFRHLDSSEPLRKYAVEKTERLSKYLFEPVEAHWVLSVEKIRHIADVTVAANGVKINAQGSTPDMYSAIDMALDKLEIQVRKHKERVKEHKQAGTPQQPASIRYGAEPASEEAPERTGPRIVRRENQFVKPMSIEEAVMQMDLGKGDFLVYNDSASGSTNVLYRTSEGDYALIETRTK